MGAIHCLREPVEAIDLPPSNFKVCAYDTADGPTLFALCGCGWQSRWVELSPTDNVSAAADGLLKAGCEQCGVTEDARRRERAFEALVAARLIRSLRIIR